MLALSSPNSIYTLSMQARHDDRDAWRSLYEQCRDWLLAVDPDVADTPPDHVASVVAPHSSCHSVTMSADPERAHARASW